MTTRATPNQFDLMKRKPYQHNTAMTQALERTAEVYPEGHATASMSTKVKLTKMDWRHEQR